MKELSEIVSAWDDSHILATVVRVRGSSYRKPGARMLILNNGERIGSVSGGCLEADVAKKAWWYTAGNKIVVKTYEGEEYGMGCNGSVDILIERLNTPAAHRGMRFLEDRITAREPGVIATIIRGSNVGERLCIADGSIWANDIGDLHLTRLLLQEAAAVASHNESNLLIYGDCEVFVEYVPAQTPLLIFGAGPDVTPLVAISKEMGWHVTVAATRPAKFLADQVVLLPSDDPTCGVDLRPNTVIVMMTHSYEMDRELLQRLLPLHPRYLGLLGPRSRTDKLLEEIGGQLDARELHSPIGIGFPGHSPETIALSIAAEIQTVISSPAVKLHDGSVDHIETRFPTHTHGTGELSLQQLENSAHAS